MNPSFETPLVCPVCDNSQTHFALRVKDHSITGEYFEIFECKRCSLRFTKGAPSEDKIGSYYQSEDYISHSNTRKGFVNFLYHHVRSRTLEAKCHLIKKTTRIDHGHHLDIGAGTGAFVQFMNRHGWDSVGIEPDEKARGQAEINHNTKLLPSEELECLLAESFDSITLWHVLEHVHNLYPFLNKIKRLLKPAGLVFIAVPNYMSFDALRYGADWAAYDVPRHLYHFSPASMRWLIKEAGFQMKSIHPMWWDSYYISLLSEKYAGSKAAMLKGFITGTISNMKALTNNEKCSSLIFIAGK